MAADVRVAIDRVVIPTNAPVNSEHDVAIPAGLGPIKAAIIMVTGAADIASGSPAIQHWTFWTPTEGAKGVAGTDNSENTTNTESQSRMEGSYAFRVQYVGGSGPQWGETISIVNGGATMRFRTTLLQDAGDRVFNVIMFGGADLTGAYVGQATFSSQGGKNIRGVGFEPDVLFGTCINNNQINTGQGNNLMARGIAINDGTNGGAGTQKSVSMTIRRNETVAEPTALVTDDTWMWNAYRGGTLASYTVTSYDSDGFNLTTAASNATGFVYLALKFAPAADVDLALFDVDIPTAGNISETSPGFQPILGIVGVCDGPTAYNTAASNNTGSVSIAAFCDDQTTECLTASYSNLDGVTTHVAGSVGVDGFKMLETDRTLGFDVEGSDPVFTANGWDITLTNNPAGNPHKGFGFALGIGAVAPGPVTASGTPQAEPATSVGNVNAYGNVTVSGTPQASVATSVGNVSVGAPAITASGTPQAEVATSVGTIEALVRVSGTPQASVATSVGNVNVGTPPITASGTPQAELATSVGTIEVLIKVSGTPQAEPATSVGNVNAFGNVTASGTPQASVATSIGNVAVEAVVASGTPQAEPATSVGTIEALVRVSGTPQASPATSVGSVDVTTFVTASGTPQASVATSVGNVDAIALVTVSGSPQASVATSVGLAGPPHAGPFELRIKLPNLQWVSIMDHTSLINVGPDDHHNQQHALYGSDHTDVDTTNAPVVGAGLVYDGANWTALPAFVAIGYGGVTLDTPASLPNLGSGWEVLPADAGSLSSPVDVTQDFANNGIRFNRGGIWRVAIGFTLDHNESNQGRTTNLRLFNDTDSVPGRQSKLFIARNQPGTNYATTFLVEIPPSAVGDLFQVEIGGGSSITSVTLENFIFDANHVSEYIN